MGKFLIGLVTGFILTGLVLVIVVFALMRLRGAPPGIPDNAALLLQLEGEIPERAPVEFPIPLIAERQQPTVQEVWSALRKAAADSRIKAIVLEPKSLDIGWGKLEEIRADLEQFRRSGKPLIAFLRTPGTREYYLATAADHIYLSPGDQLYLKGMRVQTMYFKQTLDKLGVDVQVEHAGKYKDFGDMFTRSSMSPETREVLNSILDDLYGNLLTRISMSRRKTPEEVRSIIDNGPFLAEQARAAGLVDELRYEDQVFGELKQRLHSPQDLRKVALSRYIRIPSSSLGLEGNRRIALLVGEGAITGGSTTDDGLSNEGITAEGFTKLLRRVQSDSSIDGVVVRVDSPGGEVVASDRIWREMNLLSKKKPTVISMSDTAASGGYYMAMTGDPIVCYPGTLTGSIGVVFGKPNLRGLYGKLGIAKDTLTRGRFADIDSDYRPLEPAELEKLRQGISATYRDFVNKVAQARRRNYSDVEPIAQGRVWLGSQAKAKGLVDDLGGFDRAIELVKQKARIPASEKVSLVLYPPRRSIFEVLFGRSSEDILQSRLGSLRRLWNARVWLKPGLFSIMPYVIEVY